MLGAIVTTGDANQPLGSDLLGAIAEIRVEQTLDGPSSFAVRFADDLRAGRPLIAEDPRLAIGTVLSVLVEVDGQLTCLIRGPITDHAGKVMLGGPGSAFDVIGLDSLDLMDRTCRVQSWDGRASDIAASVLAEAGFDSREIEDTPRVYEESGNRLNQRTTDLDFLMQIAQRNNLHLWLGYAASRTPVTGAIAIVETVNLASSPRRPEGALGALAGAISLIPTSEVELRVQVPGDQNVTAFEIRIDSRRPTRYRGGAMALGDGRPVGSDASDTQPPAGAEGQSLTQVGGTRDLCMVGSGDPVETQRRAEGALTEAGWFVHANASTSTHLLRGVLQPHDIVRAVGVGPRLGDTAFRVRGATHVITPAHHMIDAELDSNRLGGA